MQMNTAVVLAGGPGDRLRPLTRNAPKPLIEVYGKPLLQWVIEWLRANHVDNIVIGVAYMKEKIMERFGDGSRFGVDISYSVHSVEGGTGEGFSLAISRFVDDDVFFAMNSDQITDLNLSKLATFHLKHHPTATIAVTNPPCPFGILEVDENCDIIGFSEKPRCPSVHCSTGIYVFDRSILKYLPINGDVEKVTFPRLSEMGSLKAYSFSGSFITINTVKDFIAAENELRKRVK